MSGYLIRNGRVYADGAFIEADVLVSGSKIERVGKGLYAPEGVCALDAREGYVLPGLIDAHCHIGVFETASDGSDGNEFSGPVTPELRALDGVNPLDPEFSEGLRAGVTCVATGPGSANPIAGQFLLMKTLGQTADAMCVRAPLAMKMAFGENPKRAYGASGKAPVTRMATAALIREWLFRAREYGEKLSLAERLDDPSKKPAFDMRLEALLPVVRGALPVKAHAHRADDILTAIRIAREFGLSMSIEHATEGHLIAAELAEAGVPLVLGPYALFPQKREMRDATPEAAGVLHRAGVKFAIMTDLPAAHLGFLPTAVGMCVAAGLPESVGFDAITARAASILGVGDRLGRLQPGFDADIAVFSGNPLTQIGARCVLTLCGGQLAHHTEE